MSGKGPTLAQLLAENPAARALLDGAEPSALTPAEQTAANLDAALVLTHRVVAGECDERYGLTDDSGRRAFALGFLQSAATSAIDALRGMP